MAAEPGRTRPASSAALRAAGTGAALAAAAVLLTACGSGGPHPAAAPAASVTAACSAVSAALADGPDPGADPVGYAEAQVRPLRAIRTSDAALRTAVGQLAGAYARVLASGGTSAAARKAVAAAEKNVNSICPGAAS